MLRPATTETQVPAHLHDPFSVNAPIFRYFIEMEEGVNSPCRGRLSDCQPRGVRKLRDTSNSTLVHLQFYADNARTHPHPDRSSSCRRASRASASDYSTIVDQRQGQKLSPGHARVEAAKALGINRIPCVTVEHLSKAQEKAYRLADNQLSELATWDFDLLAKELRVLTDIDVDFSIEVTGFDTAKIDLLIEERERKQRSLILPTKCRRL